MATHMTDTPDILRIALAQLNPTLGDIKGNIEKARKARKDAFANDTKDGGPGVLIGSPYRNEDGLYNAVALLDNGKIQTLTKDQCQGL